MTYDPASNQLFFGTSGAYPYQHAERSPAGGSNLFLSSVVAVDADTGEYRWHYQTVDRDSWDYNATMNIVLADVNIHGEARETLCEAARARSAERPEDGARRYLAIRCEEDDAVRSLTP